VPVPHLERTQVHVWTASLAAECETLTDSYAALTTEERARAASLRSPQLRRRFVGARAFLRWLLSSYLRVDASTLRLGYADHGKPYVVSDSGLCFNLSHSEDMVMYAFAAWRDVGIDIEATTNDVDIAGVARHAFSPAECEALAALSPEERSAAFFRIWTRKEAYVKARGDGLGYPTRTFSVSHLRGGSDVLVADERQAEAASDWRVVGLTAPDGFCAALSARGRDWSTVRLDARTLL
jgi:4'-phosphopantetheinyl transferase